MNKITKWNITDLPRSWDRALDRFGQVPYDDEHDVDDLSVITFHDLVEQTTERYFVKYNKYDIGYYRYHDYWYCQIGYEHNIHYYTYINNKIQFCPASPLLPFAQLLAQNAGYQDDDIMDHFLAIGQTYTKSAQNE